MSDGSGAHEPAKKSFDPVEVEKFKKRFAAERAQEIESANEVAVEKEQAVAKSRVKLEKLRKTAKLEAKKWQDKKGLREKKPKPGIETPPEKDLRLNSEAADQARDAEKLTLETAEAELKQAITTLEKSPREAYTEKFQKLIKRLSDATKIEGQKNSGTKITDLDPNVVMEIKALINQRDYDGVDQRILACENLVFDTVADKEFPLVHKALASRIETLKTQHVKESKAIQDLESEFQQVVATEPTGERLATLERDIEPKLNTLERRVQDFLDLHKPLEGEIANLERKGVEKAAEYRKELRKCWNLAAKQLDDAKAQTLWLQKEVQKTQEELRDEASAEQLYPGELAAARQQIADFEDISDTHKSYKSALKQQDAKLDTAVKLAKEQKFRLTRIVIEEVVEKLDEWDAKATNTEEAKADKQAKLLLAAKIKKAQDAKAAAEKKALQDAAAALQLQKDAVNTASLDAIGKDSDFMVWMDKVETLLNETPALVVLDIGAGYWLNGNSTVEIEIGVQGAGQDAFEDFFVIHYHPYEYVNPNTNITEPPKMHAKPYCGNAATPHDYRINTQSSHWLFKRNLPTLKKITTEFT